MHRIVTPAYLFADLGSDFSVNDTLTATFPGGMTSEDDIACAAITILNDGDVEVRPQNLTVELTSTEPPEVTIGSPSVTVITITDNDGK